MSSVMFVYQGPVGAIVLALRAVSKRYVMSSFPRKDAYTRPPIPTHVLSSNKKITSSSARIYSPTVCIISFVSHLQYYRRHPLHHHHSSYNQSTGTRFLHRPQNLLSLMSNFLPHHSRKNQPDCLLLCLLLHPVPPLVLNDVYPETPPTPFAPPPPTTTTGIYR